MNECLLVKWIWKITQGSEGLWFKLLKAKYMPDGNFFTSRSIGTSQFWQGLHKVKHLFKWGANYKVKDGRMVSFWDDPWIGDAPIRVLYPTLYSYCNNKQSTVKECSHGENWTIDFNRSFNAYDWEQWNNLMTDLQEVKLEVSGEGDEIMWGLNKTGVFTTRSLYKFMTHGGVISKAAELIWKCKLPLKIKIFLWQIYHGKLQASAVLKRRGWKGDHRCSLCGVTETIDHIFFACPLGNFVWSCIRDTFGWDGFPSSSASLLGSWLINNLNVSKVANPWVCSFLQVSYGLCGEPGTRWRLRKNSPIPQLKCCYAVYLLCRNGWFCLREKTGASWRRWRAKLSTGSRALPHLVPYYQMCLNCDVSCVIEKHVVVLLLDSHAPW